MQSPHSQHTINVAQQNQHLDSIILASAYPFLGIAYFLKTPRLWCQVITHLVIAILLVIACIVALFVGVFPLQAILLQKAMPAGWAWVVSFFLVIVESALATLLVGLIYLQAIALDQIFDKVVMLRGHTNVVKGVHTGARRSFQRFLHPILYALTTLVTLPITLIPVVGQIAFFVLSKYFVSWGCHMHYFDLKGMNWSESKDYIKRNWADYLLFGGAGGVMEAIPLAGLFFMVTNIIGSALWACDLEEANRAPHKMGVAVAP